MLDKPKSCRNTMASQIKQARLFALNILLCMRPNCSLTLWDFLSVAPNGAIKTANRHFNRGTKATADLGNMQAIILSWKSYVPHFAMRTHVSSNKVYLG